MLLMAVLASACSYYPLGISEQQWQAMTADQRHEAYMEQSRQNDAERERMLRLQQTQLVLQEQQRRERELQLEQAGPGQVLQCVLDQVEADFGKNKWRKANPVALELLQGEQQALVLERADKNHQQLVLRARFEPMQLRLCDRNSCASVVGTRTDFQRGRWQPVTAKTFKAVVKCQYRSHYPAWR